MSDRESVWCEGGRVGSSQGKIASHSIFKKVILSGVGGGGGNCQQVLGNFCTTSVSFTSNRHSLPFPPVKFQRKNILLARLRIFTP